MTTCESTRQQLDPAATFGAYPSTVLCALFAVIWAIGSTIVTGERADQADRTALTVTSLILLVAAALWVVRSADPLRAPFPRRSLVFVYALAAGAIVTSMLASLGFDRYIGDDWGPIAIAMLTIAVTPYRPAREVAIALAIVMALLAVVVSIKVPYFAGDGPGVAFVVVGIVPTLSVSVAAIYYSRYLVAGLQSWHRRADVGAASLAIDMVGGVASSVGRERVLILSREVSPFFTELLERGSIGESDRARARAIAESMRSELVDDANRTWLSIAFGTTARGDGFLSIDDPSFLAGDMITRQRTALRAILVAATDDDRLDKVRVGIHPDGGIATVLLHLVALPDRPRGVAADYATYFSVLRVVFAAFHVDVENETVNVRFDYDRS